MSPADPVDAQLEAYNGRDVEAFVACYAAGVLVEDGAGTPLMRGRDALRAEYGPFFEAAPDLRVEILHRIRIGAYVIDEERITGWEPQPVRAVVVYHVADGLIDRVRFYEDA